MQTERISPENNQWRLKRDLSHMCRLWFAYWNPSWRCSVHRQRISFMGDLNHSLNFCSKCCDKQAWPLPDHHRFRLEIPSMLGGWSYSQKCRRLQFSANVIRARNLESGPRKYRYSAWRLYWFPGGLRGLDGFSSPKTPWSSQWWIGINLGYCRKR